MKKFLYPIFAIPFYGLALLPFPLLYMLSNGLYFLSFYVIGYRKKVVYSNLQNAFPTYTPSQIDSIAKKFYAHLMDTFLETFKLLSISKKRLGKYGIYTNLHIIDELVEQNKSFIILTGHMGNWELLPNIWQLAGTTQICGIYHQLSSPFFEWLTHKFRTRFGIQMIPMEKTLRAMVANRNKATGTGFISDQTPSNENAHWLTFLNQDTPVFIGAEKIAKRFNYPVVYCHVTKPRRGFYEIILEIITLEPQATPDLFIIETFNKKLEEDIINQPEIWLWSHRRWKHKRK